MRSQRLTQGTNPDAHGFGLEYRGFYNYFKQMKIKWCYIPSRVLLRKNANEWVSCSHRAHILPANILHSNHPRGWGLLSDLPQLLCSCCLTLHWLPSLTSPPQAVTALVAGLRHWTDADRLNNGRLVELVTTDEAYCQPYKFFFFTKQNVFYI